jgi:hypothetical protein
MNSKERAISRKVYLLIVLGLIVIGVAWTRIQTARNLSIPAGHEERTLTIGGLERRQQQTVPPRNGTGQSLQEICKTVSISMNSLSIYGCLEWETILPGAHPQGNVLKKSMKEVTCQHAKFLGKLFYTHTSVE